MLRYLYRFVLPGGRRLLVVYYPPKSDDDLPKPLVEPVRPNYAQLFAQAGLYQPETFSTKAPRVKRGR